LCLLTILKIETLKIEILLTTEKLPDKALLECAKKMLVACGKLSQAEAEGLGTAGRCRKIDSDGSTRRFWRLMGDGGPFCLLAAPAGTSPVELAESRSAWFIGRHLFKKGVPVPELYGWDESSGILLFEDLGDTRLQDIVVQKGEPQSPPGAAALACYQSVLEHLAAMQYLGAVDFDQSWCWDSARYDTRLMVEKESGYFLRAFWQDFLGKEYAEGVVEELQEIARQAGEAPADFFLHRDFQSRNIMVQKGSVRFIDFQGGRLGPLGYDLASLLIDPYCSLPLSVQDELVAFYLKAIDRYLTIDAVDFKKQYTLLAVQRNLQIVGAFSFLYKVRQKPFFMDFIRPSLVSLSHRLGEPLFQDYPLIRTMVNRGIKELVPA